MLNIAYCYDNHDTAERIAADLQRAGIQCNLLSPETAGMGATFMAALQAGSEPVLLLVTDNLLKSQACMSGARQALLHMMRQNRLLTVVADGKASRDGGQTYESVPTHFDRVVYAIQYMNYWQSAYLELSDHVRHAETADREEIEANLSVVRDIANEMGDMISALRDSDFIGLQPLQASNYEKLFRTFGWRNEQQQYMASLHAPVDPEPPAAEIPEPAAQATQAAAVDDVPFELEVPDEVFNEEQTGAPVETKDDDDTDTALTAPPPSGFIAFTPAESPVGAREELWVAPDDLPEGMELLPDREERSPAEIEAEIAQTIQDARLWLERGHIDLGLQIFQAAIEQYPDHDHLRRSYRMALAQYNQEVESASTEEEINAAAQSEARSYELMGEMSIEKSDYLFAKYCWDRVIELDEHYPGIYRKLALMVDQHLPEYKETKQFYLQKALEQSPDDAELEALALQMAQSHTEPETPNDNDSPAQAIDLSDEAPEQEAKLFIPEEEPLPLQTETPEPDQDEETGASDETLAETEAIVSEETPEPDQNEETGASDETLVETEAIVFEETPEPDDATDEYLAESEAIAPEETIEPALESAPDSDDWEDEAATTEEAIAPPVQTYRGCVLITGATSGIGRATALEFAKAGGYRLILTGRRAQRLAELEQALHAQYGCDILSLAFDVRDNAAVEQALLHLPEGWQDVDILINNAGLAKGFSPIHEGSLDHWETMIDTNIKGLLYVTRCISPGMVARRKGLIINVGSTAGKETYANGNVYSATKFAVEALTRSMRLDLHKYNIRVGQVSPGHVEETEFALNRFDGDVQRARSVYENFQPLKSSDIAETIYFMASRPAHVNIQDIWLFGTQQASASVVERSGR